MRIYWWTMTGLMLFPWMLALVPRLWRRIGGFPSRGTHAVTCDGFELSC